MTNPCPTCQKIQGKCHKQIRSDCLIYLKFTIYSLRHRLKDVKSWNRDLTKVVFPEPEAYSEKEKPAEWKEFREQKKKIETPNDFAELLESTKNIISARDLAKMKAKAKENAKRPRNRAKCRMCGTIIESKYRHDFVWCNCGKIAVDGGRDYFKRIGEPENIIEVPENIP